MTDRLADLHAKLRAREGNAEYRENVKFIRDEIARLEAEQPEDNGNG